MRGCNVGNKRAESSCGKFAHLGVKDDINFRKVFLQRRQSYESLAVGGGGGVLEGGSNEKWVC